MTSKPDFDPATLEPAPEGTTCQSKRLLMGYPPNACEEPAAHVIGLTLVCASCASFEWERYQYALRHEPEARRLDGPTPTATQQYVRVQGMQSLRFEVDSTPGPDGKVWLRPAFVAMLVPSEMIEPWPKDE